MSLSFKEQKRAEERDARLSALALRIRQGKPIGEFDLYGRTAVELVRYGHLNESELAPYRSGAFFARRDFYGEAAALAWEREQKRQHQIALHFFGGGKG